MEKLCKSVTRKNWSFRFVSVLAFKLRKRYFKNSGSLANSTSFKNNFGKHLFTSHLLIDDKDKNLNNQTSILSTFDRRKNLTNYIFYALPQNTNINIIIWWCLELLQNVVTYERRFLLRQKILMKRKVQLNIFSNVRYRITTTWGAFDFSPIF